MIDNLNAKAGPVATSGAASPPSKLRGGSCRGAFWGRLRGTNLAGPGKMGEGGGLILQKRTD